MKHFQPGILADVPASARYQFFRLKPGKDPVVALKALADFAVENNVVVGLGQSLLSALNVAIPDMRKMPEFAGKGVETPSTPFSLWCWIRGEDRGDLLHKARNVRALLTETFTLELVCDAFKFADSRDLTGYEDGTENPEGEEALAVAFVDSAVKGLAGSSFVAVQQWQHDLDVFQAMSRQQQDHTIGRDQETNEELDDAPKAAHVKRAEQEAFDPEAFMLRRSMPWANEEKEGLVFVAFGKSFDAFEVVMQRMVGMDDGIVDALFSFTKPLTGSYFWCPPVSNGKLDLSYLIK
jgi:putative iron-dependent peroxidase